MRFIKPVWLTHSGEKKDFEVYSCNVSPDGKRLATAAGDGQVRVWSTEAILNAGDPAFTGPRQLASMNTHSGTIHTVRFSFNNRYLASGADDKIVCVYTLDPHPPSHSASFGSNEAPPTEHWSVFRRLIGHDNDVQDLGWSYDTSILVTVGLDSKVVIWSGHTFEKLKTLSNHQSHVKGLTFDPANKYFATASDDRSIKIFRFTPPTPNSTAHDQVNNFVLETSIVTPFTASPLTTYFRRCSWSPDGNHIAAANAVNGPVPSVAIINRGVWDSEINLIGHEAPVEVCAFSPRLFAREKPGPINKDGNGNSMQNLVTVIACAGQDKALSVWNTSHPRPLLITQELAKKSISDVAWTPDGRTLFATSLDGSVIAVAFDDGDLGYAMGPEESERSLAKFGANRRGAGIVEGTEALLLEEQSRAGEMSRVKGRMGELMGDAAAAPGSAINGTASGVPTNGVPTLGPSPTVNGVSNQQNGIAQAGVNQPTPDQQQIQNDLNAVKLERLKQRVTITKDGKKRIAPLLLTASSGAAQSSLPTSQLMAPSTSTQGTKNDAPYTMLDLSKPFDGLPQGGLSALLLGNKRKFDADIEPSRNGSVPVLMNTVEGKPVPFPPVASGVVITPEWIRPAVVNPAMSVSQMRLAVPKIRTQIIRSLDSSGNIAAPTSTKGATDVVGQDSTGPELVLEAKNPSTPSPTGRPQDREPSRVTVSRRGQIVWQDFLPRSVLLVTGNQNFWGVACEEGSIFIWTPAGRRSVPALVVEAQSVILESRGWWLLCIAATGTCYVWNLKTMSSPHPPISLAPALNIAQQPLTSHLLPAPAITSARLNSRGNIIITLNNGEGFTYSPGLYVWQRLTEPWWAVGSQYWNTTDSSVGNLQASVSQPQNSSDRDGDVSNELVSAGIIPQLERSTTNEVLLRGRGYHLQRLFKVLLAREGFEGFESAVSVGHLETRMAAAMQLGAREEFQMYLYMYARRIGAEGLKAKVEELLKSLHGPFFVDQDVSQSGNIGQGWESEDTELCGWDRRELLRRVVLILGKHRELQRITVPYAKMLGVTVTGQDGGTQPMAL